MTVSFSLAQSVAPTMPSTATPRPAWAMAPPQADTASFTVLRGGRQITVLHPERRWFPIAQTLTTQAANRLTPMGDLYLVMGDPRGDDNQAHVVRAYVHPLVGLIWLGVLIMVGGGVVSLSDGRYRIGAPVRRLKPAPATLVAAE